MTVAEMIQHRIAHYPRAFIMAQSHKARAVLMIVEEGQSFSVSDVAWLMAGDMITDREAHHEQSEFGTGDES